jgi:hypothetical protein
MPAREREKEREKERERERERETCNIVEKRASSIDSSGETVLQGVDLLVGAYVVVAQILVVNNVGFALALHLIQLNVNHALSRVRALSLSLSLSRSDTHTHTCMRRVNEKIESCTSRRALSTSAPTISERFWTNCCSNRCRRCACNFLCHRSIFLLHCTVCVLHAMHKFQCDDVNKATTGYTEIPQIAQIRV